MRHKFTFIEKGIAALIVACLFFIFMAAKQQAKEREAFMRDCMRDLKEYECTIMWKNAQPDTQTIIIPSS